MGNGEAGNRRSIKRSIDRGPVEIHTQTRDPEEGGLPSPTRLMNVSRRISDVLLLHLVPIPPGGGNQIENFSHFYPKSKLRHRVGLEKGGVLKGTVGRMFGFGITAVVVFVDVVCRRRRCLSPNQNLPETSFLTSGFGQIKSLDSWLRMRLRQNEQAGKQRPFGVQYLPRPDLCRHMA
ncbi:hypothetical protein ZHAS_00008754 [Anopheles sinensis]|uniref:Uncharacterized protein n=1 Tax=Anopheles sinensis TaxID=74873 RepID=A0A084VT97_ANOSI|nr:hypothetical protein ZHAS_00008754 [Anopheles sinensis]